MPMPVIWAKTLAFGLDSSWPDDERSHHFIVLMFEHVTVPNVSSSVALKLNDNTGDCRWINPNRVFPPEFGCSERQERTGDDDFPGQLIDGKIAAAGWFPNVR